MAEVHEMETFLKNSLGCQYVKKIGSAGGGCISDGCSYETDNYGRVFVKSNTNTEVSAVIIKLCLLIF